MMMKLDKIAMQTDELLLTFCFGLPITAGKTALGQSSPAMPVLQRPEPLSMTTAGFDIVTNF